MESECSVDALKRVTQCKTSIVSGHPPTFLLLPSVLESQPGFGKEDKIEIKSSILLAEEKPKKFPPLPLRIRASGLRF